MPVTRERDGVNAYGMYTTDPVYMYGQKGETVGGRVWMRLGGTGPVCIYLHFNTRKNWNSQILCITKLTRYRYLILYCIKRKGKRDNGDKIMRTHSSSIEITGDLINLYI